MSAKKRGKSKAKKATKTKSKSRTPKKPRRTQEVIQKEALDAFNSKNYPKTIEILEIAVKKYKKNSVFWNLLGKAYQNMGNYERALEHYELDIKINPKNPTTWENMGVVYQHFGNLRRAAECHTKAGMYYSGFGLKMKNKYNLSLQNFEKAIQLDPTIPDRWDAMVWTRLGNTHYGLGNFQKAMECYEVVLQTVW